MIAVLLGAIGFLGVVIVNVIGQRWDVVAVGVAGLLWVGAFAVLKTRSL